MKYILQSIEFDSDIHSPRVWLDTLAKDGYEGMFKVVESETSIPSKLDQVELQTKERT